MSSQRDEAHVRDILRATELIDQFAGETDAADFNMDDFFQSAILHQFSCSAKQPDAFLSLSVSNIRTCLGGRWQECVTS